MQKNKQVKKESSTVIISRPKLPIDWSQYAHLTKLTLNGVAGNVQIFEVNGLPKLKVLTLQGVSVPWVKITCMNLKNLTINSSNPTKMWLNDRLVRLILDTPILRSLYINHSHNLEHIGFASISTTPISVSIDKPNTEVEWEKRPNTKVISNTGDRPPYACPNLRIIAQIVAQENASSVISSCSLKFDEYFKHQIQQYTLHNNIESWDWCLKCLMHGFQRFDIESIESQKSLDTLGQKRLDIVLRHLKCAKQEIPILLKFIGINSTAVWKPKDLTLLKDVFTARASEQGDAREVGHCTLLINFWTQCDQRLKSFKKYLTIYLKLSYKLYTTILVKGLPESLAKKMIAYLTNEMLVTQYDQKRILLDHMLKSSEVPQTAHGHTVSTQCTAPDSLPQRPKLMSGPNVSS